MRGSESVCMTVVIGAACLICAPLFGPSRSEWMPECSFYDLKEEWERLVTYLRQDHVRKRSLFRARELPRHKAACPAVWQG
jgi:hypothetical protein